MEQRKSYFILSIIGIMALVLCLSGTAIGGPGPNSGSEVPEGFKTSGPSPKAFLMAGWTASLDCFGTNQGVLEAYVWVGDKIYMAILDDCYPEELIKEAKASDLVVVQEEDGRLTGWIFPDAIAEAYNFPGVSTDVVILNEKDVTEWCEEETCETQDPGCEPVDCEEGEGLVLVDIDEDDLDFNPRNLKLQYEHILRTDVKLSFLVSSDK